MKTDYEHLLANSRSIEESYWIRQSRGSARKAATFFKKAESDLQRAMNIRLQKLGIIKNLP